jgi:hypothetical protein
MFKLIPKTFYYYNKKDFPLSCKLVEDRYVTLMNVFYEFVSSFRLDDTMTTTDDKHYRLSDLLSYCEYHSSETHKLCKEFYSITDIEDKRFNDHFVVELTFGQSMKLIFGQSNHCEQGNQSIYKCFIITSACIQYRNNENNGTLTSRLNRKSISFKNFQHLIDSILSGSKEHPAYKIAFEWKNKVS